jgi:hypothetical protein
VGPARQLPRAKEEGESETLRDVGWAVERAGSRAGKRKEGREGIGWAWAGGPPGVLVLNI